MEIKNKNKLKFKSKYKSSVDYKNFESDSEQLNYGDWLKKYKESDMALLPDLTPTQANNIRDYIDYRNLNEPDKTKHVEVNKIDITDVTTPITTPSYYWDSGKWMDNPEVIIKMSEMNSKISEAIGCEQRSKLPVKNYGYPKYPKRSNKLMKDDIDLL